MSSINRSVFIVAPLTKDADAVRDVIRTLPGVNEVRSDFPTVNDTIVATVRSNIKNADFLCAVFDAIHPSLNLSLEIGIAIGLQKPIFLVLVGDALPPQALKPFPSIRVLRQQFDPLKFHLRIFLENLKQSGDKVYRYKNTGSSKSLSKLGTPTFVQPDQAMSRSFLEKRVETLLARFAKVTSAETLAAEGRVFKPDMVAWLSGPNAEQLAQPFIIEVLAKGALSESIGVAKLRDYVRSTYMGTGLLIIDSSSETIESVAFGDADVFKITTLALERVTSAEAFVNALIQSATSSHAFNR